MGGTKPKGSKTREFPFAPRVINPAPIAHVVIFSAEEAVRKEAGVLEKEMPWLTVHHFSDPLSVSAFQSGPVVAGAWSSATVGWHWRLASVPTKTRARCPCHPPRLPQTGARPLAHPGGVETGLTAPPPPGRRTSCRRWRSCRRSRNRRSGSTGRWPPRRRP